MEALRQYVVSVVAAAMIGGIILGLFPKGKARELMKMLCAVGLSLTVLRPVSRLDLSQFPEFYRNFTEEAAQTAALGEAYSENMLRSIIKNRCTAYIQDKAENLGVKLSVEVSLDTDAVPVLVRLTGNISPYHRAQLTGIIHRDLGISKENQIWTT